MRKGTSGSLTDVPPSDTKHLTYKTETQLKALTATSSGWSEENWDFGTNQQLPRLRNYVPASGGTEPKEHTMSSLGKDMEALEQLMGSPTQDAAVDGSAYQRIKQLVADVEAVKQQLDSSDDGGGDGDNDNDGEDDGDDGDDDDDGDDEDDGDDDTALLERVARFGEEGGEHSNFGEEGICVGEPECEYHHLHQEGLDPTGGGCHGPDEA